MGRHIYDHKGNWVWKYAFGAQPSEQHRVHTQLGIGHYHDNVYARGERNHDRLSLSRKDLERLKLWLKPHRKMLADFLRDYRRVFKKGSALMEDARALELRHPGLYFYSMCNRFVKDGKKFFNDNPKSPMWHLYGEM